MMQSNYGRLSRRKASRKKATARLLATAILLLAANSGMGQTSGPVSDVNPFVGTGRGPTSPSGNSTDSNLFPGAVMPFGMVQLSPDTENHGFGYHYWQDAVQGFSMTHLGGVGCPSEGEVFFAPTTGAVAANDYASPYSHQREAASPGFYQVHLSRWDTDVELSATTRAGVVRITFPAGQAANLLVPVSHTLNHTMASAARVVGDRRIEGYVVNRAFCNRIVTYKVFFVMTFDRPFAAFGTWDRTDAIQSGSRAAEQTGDDQHIGAYVTWPASAKPQSVTARIAISYVDAAGAENNLKAEVSGKTFGQIHAAAVKAWNDELSLIKVSGGTASDRRVFYTALYHSLLMPSILSDADGRYLGFDGEIHRIAAGHLIYGNLSGWDIYRSQIPLLALIEPRRTEDIAQSIVLQYRQGGWIDRWPQINLYTNVMAGSPLTTILATAWLDGLHGFDMDTAWKGMYMDATEAPPPGKPYVGQSGIKWINQFHYAPDDKVHYGSVSQIMEDATAYAALYRVAAALGKTDAARTLYDRALYYRNVFDPADRFFRPRNSDGQWAEPFNPEQERGFIEGTGWHYQWAASWDMRWVINAVGADRFNQRLTAFFDYEHPGWTARYYNPYNETDLQAPFEFNFSGQPWRAQRAVRRVLAENYTDDPNGVPGNDDCGQMSSWAVMSMMGIYSVDPASLAYELVSPVFSRVEVSLRAPYRGKAFTISASPDPRNNAYIQSVELNGKGYSRNWIPFQAISDGGNLRITLGIQPNRSWGTASKDIPPSLSDARL